MIKIPMTILRYLGPDSPWGARAAGAVCGVILFAVLVVGWAVFC